MALPVILLVVLAGYPALLAPTLRPLALWLGTGAALALGVALVTGRQGLVGWAVGALAGLYLAALLVRGAGLDPAAPLVGAGLLAIAELADATRRRRADHDGLPPAARRAPAIAALGAVAFAGSLLLLATNAAPPWSLGLLGVGMTAAVTLLALLARLSGR